MTEKLSFYAGEKALAMIREQGLSSDRIKVISGAAGGPKWIVLYGLDRMIFSSWMADRVDPLYLLGSSIGAFRFSTAMGTSPEEAVDRLLDAYIHQAYVGRPSPKEVSDTTIDIINHALGDSGLDRIFDHPFLRLNILTVRCKGLGGYEQKIIQGLGMGAAALSNLVGRKNLKYFFERTVFFDSRDQAPFHVMSDFPTRLIPLNKDNLLKAALASGSIPLVMSGISGIPGTNGGMYRDGGVLDYHLDIPYGVNDGIILFPHYTDRITPGWLDKKLPWRKPRKEHVDHLLMICPSRSFIQDLPYAKIPDRSDFVTFAGKDSERFAYWKTVADKSRELADDFANAVESGKIKDRVQAFPV